LLEENNTMTLMKNILSRRAFTSLAGAAVFATMMPMASFAQDVTIPIIVKDTTSFYWQIVLAGARAAGKDLGVNVPELGAQSESDINGQITILENAVAGAPAAVVISPTEFKALGKPIDEAAKTASQPTVLPPRSRKQQARKKAKSPSSPACRVSGRWISATKASSKSSLPNIRASRSLPTSMPTARQPPAST
jgi:hypothetical protein